MRKLLVVVVLMVTAAALPQFAFAQTASAMFLNYVETTESADGVVVEAYFNLLDSDGQVLAEADISSVEVVLANGERVPAELSRPATDTHIVLVLDASGSMAQAMPQMHDAAVEGVQSAPDDSVFAVIQFSDRIVVVQDFTRDTNQVSDRIRSIFSTGNGTCLYDGLWRALEILENAPRGRRAVILFTDGNDITAAGATCSTQTYDEVINFATQQDSRVPIHTIGLSGDNSSINAEELRQMAETTGGFAEIGGASSLSLLFTRILSSLSDQWYVNTEIYPQQGQSSFNVIVTLADGTELQSSEVTFTASRDFEAPARVTVQSVDYSARGDALLEVGTRNAEAITSVEVELIDTETNASVGPFTFEANEEVRIPAEELADGETYRVQITGLSAVGERLTQSSYEFEYDPVIVEGELRILSVQLDEEAPAFIVQLQEQNLEGVAAYDIWLLDEETNTVVPGTRQTIDPTTRAVITLGDVGNGEYSIVVNALTGGGVVLADDIYDGAVFRMGLLARLGRTVRQAIWVPIVAGVFALGGGVALFALLRSGKKEEPKVILNASPPPPSVSVEPSPAAAADQRVARMEAKLAGPASPRREPPSRPPDARAALVVTQAQDGALVGKRFAITTTPITIGRTDAMIVIASPGVSRRHATIASRGGAFTIRDDGSTNGTTVDGKRIDANLDVPLNDGSRIGLGEHLTLRFEIEG